ncbi:Ig-like domain-containing protein [Jiangella asiatica]|nr:Ig-like domain-containing protein [Jiangella asiatica]
MTSRMATRLSAWWAIAAALVLVTAIVITGATVSAQAQQDPLPTMTATPETDTRPSTSIGSWATLIPDGQCPAESPNMSAWVIRDPADRTIAGNGGLGGQFARSINGSPFNTLGWTPSTVPTAIGAYEILAFCYSGFSPSDTNAIPSFSAWLTFNATHWWITPEPRTAETTAIEIEVAADGEPVTSVPAGADVEITATMEPAEAEGSVEFFDANPDNQDEPLSLGDADVEDGTATLTWSDLAAGDYVLTAAFTPDDPDAFEPSATTGVGVPLTVVAPEAESTTTTLTVAPDSPVDPGTEVTLTAEIDPSAAVGDVQFRVGTDAIGEPIPVEEGVAVLTTTELREGQLSLTASFTPDDPEAFTSSTSTPVIYTVGEAGPHVVAVDADGNELGENPELQDGQVVTLTAPGFQAEEEVTIALDPTSEAPQELGTVAADDEGAATTEFTASNLEPGQHQLDFVGADQTLTWEFQMAGEDGEEDGTEDGTDDGTEDGTEDGGDETGAVDGSADGTADGTASGGAVGGASNPSGSLAQTGVFLIGPAILLGLAAVSAGYGFVRRSKRDELLTFDDQSTT